MQAYEIMIDQVYKVKENETVRLSRSSSSIGSEKYIQFKGVRV